MAGRNDSFSLPAIALPGRDARLLARDEELRHRLDSALEDARRRCGPHLTCHLGCAVCCFGPFPVTLIDAWRLRQGLASLASRDPAAARGIRQRASAAADRLLTQFPGEATTGLLRLDADEEAAFASRHADLPCPVLDPHGGGCLLYEARPIACRTYGPPLLLEGEQLPPCPLCFRGEAAGVAESCTLEIPPSGDVAALVEAWEKAGGTDGRTLIALAVGGSGS